jgi:hypothetical protein
MIRRFTAAISALAILSGTLGPIEVEGRIVTVDADTRPNLPDMVHRKNWFWGAKDTLQ